jgi:hypothetical protein
VISDFHHEVSERCAFLVYYAASIGTLEDGTDKLSQSISKELSLLTS